MKNLFLLGVGLIIVLSSCQPNEIKPNEPDYFPTTKDSEWLYGEAQGHSFFKRALGDTVLNDTVYAQIGPEKGIATQLIRKDKGRYYSRGNIYGTFREETIFLQDNLPVGATWTNLTPGGKDVHIVVSIDNERTINGKKYNQTIEVKSEYYYTDGNGFALGATYHHTYANGIGKVMYSMDQSTEYLLKQYQIK